MHLSRERAQKILTEAVSHNSGVWEQHSYLVARCAEKIAEACPGMDSEKAYIIGLLHDVGRRLERYYVRRSYRFFRRNRTGSFGFLD